MKTTFFLLSCFALMLSTEVHGQLTMTVTSGISPQQTPVSHYIFVNRSSPRDEFTFDLAQVKASYFVGVGAKYDVKPFFFAAEAQYNKREYTYDVSFTFPEFGRTEGIVQYAEYMNVINLPLSLGVNLGAVEVASGFLPQFIVSHHSELQKLNGYSESLKFLRFGWQSGMAVRFSNLRMGLNWQMDFNNYADHVNIRNQNLALQGMSNRLLGTLSYQF